MQLQVDKSGKFVWGVGRANMAGRVEWVFDDGTCGGLGGDCTLPRGHKGSCLPALREGKRQRPTVAVLDEEKADAEADEPSPKASLALGSEHVPDRLFESRVPRVTVWYRDDEGQVKAYHGVAVRVCRLNGLLVRFIGSDDEYWVSATDDEFAWGHAYADGQSSTTAKGTARARPPARCLGEDKLAPFAAAPAQGARAWPLAFHSCLSTLRLLEWQLSASQWLKREVTMSLEAVRGRPESSADERGLTHLVDAAILLLGQVPIRSWLSSSDWPATGDWSARLRDTHTPEALQAAIELASTRVVKWPEAKHRAVRVRLSGGASSHAELEHQPFSHDDDMNEPSCFVCGHEDAQATHPRIRQLSICGVCRLRFDKCVWTCDEELLGNRCEGCAHEGAARHGCRSCGAALCERCMYVLHGGMVLGQARLRRFTIAANCPGCGQVRDESAPPGFDVRVVCDGCKQEWHPRCHAPPLTSLPGGSAKWLCADCIVGGVPKVASWSLPSCALCEQRSASGAPGLRVVRTGYKVFDHPAAVKRLNSNVDAFNAALVTSRRLLPDDKVRELATTSSAAGGLVVVSICDGKGSLLGALLRAGVRVRRYLSIEIEEAARRVCHCNYGGGNHELLGHDALRFFPDARSVTIADLKALDCWPVDLAAGGTPCNDLSGCNEAPDGVHGEQSSLIFDFVQLVCTELPKDNGGRPMAMMWENVMPSTMQAREDVSAEPQTAPPLRRPGLQATRPTINFSRRSHQVLALFGMPALASEGAVFEAARRPRWFITNLRVPRVAVDIEDKKLQDVLNPGAKALGDKANCIISATISGAGETIATAHAHSQRNRGRELVQCAAHSMEVRGLLVPEMCRAMGQPYHEVDSAPGGESAKAGLVGRSFAEGQVRHVLQTLIEACQEAQAVAQASGFIFQIEGVD